LTSEVLFEFIPPFSLVNNYLVGGLTSMMLRFLVALSIQ